MCTGTSACAKGSNSPLLAREARRWAPSGRHRERGARAQVPVATSAAALTLEYEGYVVEPAIDFNQRSGYLSVAKAHDRCAFKGSYAFKEAPCAAARSGGLPLPWQVSGCSQARASLAAAWVPVERATLASAKHYPTLNLTLTRAGGGDAGDRLQPHGAPGQ